MGGGNALVLSVSEIEALEARSPTGALNRSECTQLPDGRWQVPLDPDVYEMLCRIGSGDVHEGFRIIMRGTTSGRLQ